MLREIIVLAVVSLVVVGCSVGPDYTRPEVETPKVWADTLATPDSTIANLPWWQVFSDTTLHRLISSALTGNRDLRIAIERIEEARAAYGFTRADYYPKIDLNAGAGAVRLSEQTTGGKLADNPAGRFTLSGDLSWEIDLFGRIRRSTESQYAQLMATEEARRGVTMALVADVASTYFRLRDYDRRLTIARSTLESRAEYVRLAKIRFEGGKTGEIDYRQAEAEYARTKSIVLDLERTIPATENALSVLIGRNPGAIPRGDTLGSQQMPAEIPAGIPSELLARRPDIRQAEELLVSANANIGAAKALLYPRIGLTGSYGTTSSTLADLITAPAQAWNIAGNLLQPIFNAGQNQRRVEITESQMRQALAVYERTIFEAMSEVNDVLVAYQKSGNLRVAQGQRVEAESRVSRLAETRYTGGVAGYLEVLDAQRSLFSAQLDESQAMFDHMDSLVRVYKALGGGWVPPKEEKSK